MNVETKLKKVIQKALFDCCGYECSVEEIPLSLTEKHYKGAYTVPTFSLAKALGKSPQEVGESLGQALKEGSPWIEEYQLIHGFLNLMLSDEMYQTMVDDSAQVLTTPVPPTGQKIIVEFSCPNTNKPLHLGHLRNNAIGDALASILKEVGHRVRKVNLINDRGVHICKSMRAYQLFGGGKTPKEAGLKGDHFVGHYYVLFEKEYQRQITALMEEGRSHEQAKKEAPIMQEAKNMVVAWEAGEQQVRALWQKMNQWVYEGFEKTYARIDTSFDQYYYESNTYLLGKKVVQEGLQKELFFQQEDGSVWIDLEEEQLGTKLLLRANGTTVYITQDMGTIDARYQEFPFDQHIYVVGSEQKRHFQVLFQIMSQLGRTYAPRLHHLSYGMVDLPSGKMKSREGTTVDADHLIDEMVRTAKETTQKLGKTEMLSAEEGKRLYDILAIGAIKYFLLSVNPQKRILFDPALSIDFQGHTASFIQYTHARIQRILEKSRGAEVSSEMMGALAKDPPPLVEEEKQLILQLAAYPSSLQHAAQHYNPALLAEYLYRLAKSYNTLYARLPVLKAPKNIQARRLHLSQLTAAYIKKGMKLLGIEVPDRM